MGVTGGVIGLALGAQGGELDGSAVSASNALWLIGSASSDLLKGGAGDDVFQFTSANQLSAADTVIGGAGHDDLLVSSPGTIDASGVSGVEFYTLTGGGSNSLALADSNVAGMPVFGVQAGSGGDLIDASAVTSTATQLYLFGGAGNDTIRGGAEPDVIVSGGGNDTLSGGGGADLFAPSASGLSTILDFQSGTDRLFLSKAQFDLGASEGSTSSFDRLDPTAFSGANDGSFSTAQQRFSFDAANHQLLYAPNGSSSSPGAIHAIAVLNGVSSISPQDLFYGH